MRQLLNIEELSEWLNIPVAAARQRRYRDPESMPPAIVLGKSLRWDPEVVEVWLKERQETPIEQTNALAGGPGRSVVVPIAAGADRGE